MLKGSKLFFAKVRQISRCSSAHASTPPPLAPVVVITPAPNQTQRKPQNETCSPHGMIDLSSCMTVKSAELKAQKRNALEVSTPETTFLMFADSEKEKDDWIGAVGRAIVKSSTTYTQDDRDADDDDDSNSSDDD